MKFKIEKLNKEILERLQNQVIHLNRNTQQLNRDKEFVLFGEAMLNKIVKEVKELVNLWKDLFPKCRLQDFEPSEEKKKLPSRQKHPENRNSMTAIQEEMQTGAGIKYRISLMPRIKTEKAKHQLIYDLFRDRKIIYQYSRKKDTNYKQQYMQSQPVFVESYQFPKQLKYYTDSRIKLPALDKYSGEFDKNTYKHSPYVKMPVLYQGQAGRKSYELGAGSYKSLDSYLNGCKELD
jgi:hypothetical protein